MGQHRAILLIFLKYKFICLFLAVLGFHYCGSLSLAVESGGYPLVVVHVLLVEVTSVAERRL